MKEASTHLVEKLKINLSQAESSLEEVMKKTFPLTIIQRKSFDASPL